MAYIDFREADTASPARHAPVEPKGFIKPAAQRSALNPLEWQVVALAQGDGLSSIRPAGRLTRAFRWLFGLSVSNMLSDARLEALRRISVLSWRRGYSVAEEDVRAFIAAGFTVDHYEILLTHINAARAALPRKF